MSNLRLAKSFLWLALILMATVLSVSTWVFLNDEDRYGPEGIESAFTVNSLPASAEASTVVATVDDLTEDLGVNVYKTWPSPDDGVYTTDYYVFAGDPERVIGDLEQGSFPSFGNMYTGTLRSSDELTSEQLYGSFAVQAGPVERDLFASALSDLGAEVSVSNVPPPLLRWPLQVLAGPLGGAVLVAWLAIVLASLNFITARMTIAATRLSTGISRRSVLLRDLTALNLPTTLMAVLPTMGVIGYSFIYADGYRSATAAAMLPAQLLFVLSASLLGLALHRLFSRKFSIGKVITGARPTGLLTAIAVFAVLGSGLLASATAASLMHQLDEYQAERELDDYWSHQSGMGVMNLSYAALAEEAEAVDSELSHIYREAEQDGEVLLSEGDVLNFRGGPIQSPTGVVNSEFLRSLGVLDTAQMDQIEEHVGEEGGAVLITPPDLPETSSELSEAAREWFAFHASLDDAEAPVEPDIRVMEDLDIGVVPRFDTAFGGIEPMYLNEAALLVTDSDSGLLSEDFYAASGAYLNPSAVWQSLEDTEEAELWVTAFQDLEDSASLKAAHDRADLWTATVALITMALVIVVAWILIAAIHLSRERSRIFLMWTTGSSFWAIHRRFLMWASAGVVVPSAVYLLTSGLSASAMFVIFAGQTTVGLGAVAAALVLLGRQHHHAVLQDS